MCDVFGRRVFFTVYENLFDNRVLEENRFVDVEWGDLVEMLLKEHQVVSKKEDVKLLAPVRFIDRDDPGCHHAAYTKSEGERGFGTYGEPKTDSDGNPYIWRAAINVDAWSMLPVDIDGEQTIAQAREFFKDYTYVAYTSFSHLKDRVTEKFRLLLPLNEPVSHKDFTDRIPALKEWLGDVDLSSLAGARGFYLPSCPQERKKTARRWYNDREEFLDILSFPATKPKMPFKKALPLLSGPLPDGDYKRFLLEQLKNTYLGNYEDWWKVSSAMVDAGFTLSDFQYVTIAGMMSQKDASDCERQWEKALARHRRGNSISAGYLYNSVGGKKTLERAKLEKEIAELEDLVGVDDE